MSRSPATDEGKFSKIRALQIRSHLRVFRIEHGGVTFDDHKSESEPTPSLAPSLTIWPRNPDFRDNGTWPMARPSRVNQINQIEASGCPTSHFDLMQSSTVSVSWNHNRVFVLNI
jgi:hypothetical protein